MLFVIEKMLDYAIIKTNYLNINHKTHHNSISDWFLVIQVLQSTISETFEIIF